jgi:hypothetical protein
MSGAAVHLVTGLALTGIESLTDTGYDYVKPVLKLVVALVVAGPRRVLSPRDVCAAPARARDGRTGRLLDLGLAPGTSPRG